MDDLFYGRYISVILSHWKREDNIALQRGTIKIWEKFWIVWGSNFGPSDRKPGLLTFEPPHTSLLLVRGQVVILKKKKKAPKHMIKLLANVEFDCSCDVWFVMVVSSRTGLDGWWLKFNEDVIDIVCSVIDCWCYCDCPH